MKSRSVIHALLLSCFTAINLFSSCEKEKDSATTVSSSGVSYDLEGTSWKANPTYGTVWFLSFASDSNGTFFSKDNKYDDIFSFDFKYFIDGSYGIVNFIDGVDVFLCNDVELHLINKENISLGGTVFKRQ